MAHSVSARKRIRQNESRNFRNKAQRSAFRTEVKKVLDAASKGDVTAATKELPMAMKRIDKAAKTLAIHPNAAARYKARLHRAIRRAETAAKSPAKTASPKTTSPKKTARA